MNFYSVAREIEIGRLGAEEFARHVTVLGTAEVSEYLKALGHELSAVAPGERFTYTFVVFRGDAVASPMAFPGRDAPEVEAITLPGGPIFIPAELIEKLDSEPDLAAVLAHAISHIALRHSTRSATRGEIAGMAAQGMPPNMRNTVMMPVAFLSFARHYERDADVLAVQILAQAGYDPAGLLSYLRKLPPIGQSRAFSALPDPKFRIQTVEEAIRLLPALTYRNDARRFAEWKLAVETARVP
ncbi:MAG TPA: M48 family metalloprotease [Bryobacteraceae bacterium]|nr:M48 family metalloprotease [Bryobacteraceae bacterium]